MKFTIEGFSQKVMVSIGMDVLDAIILRWFSDFKDTGKMVRKICPNDGCEYFWVRYQAIIDDIPILGIKSKEAMARRLMKLEKCGVLKHWHCKNGGSFSMFRLDQGMYAALISDTSTLKSNPSDPKVRPPSDSKVGAKYPSTNNNPSAKLKAPNRAEVIEFFKSRGFGSDLASQFFDYYELGEWIDQAGKPVRSWKQKAIAVWMKPDRRQQQDPPKQKIPCYKYPMQVDILNDERARNGLKPAVRGVDYTMEGDVNADF